VRRGSSLHEAKRMMSRISLALHPGYGWHASCGGRAEQGSGGIG
jgi:hypothetical protein